jgi:hypothetical protein
MEKNLETPTGDVTETVTTPEVETPQEGDVETPSSSQEETDYSALIEAEKNRVPDPNKAKEAFLKREEKRKQDEAIAQQETADVDLDKPMTRREMDEYLARRQHQIITETQSERIEEIAHEIADSEGEAKFVMEIHKNRVFPEGMTLRDQLREAHFIAAGKRLAAKNLELARKVQSKDTASKDVASTHHEPQTGSAPKLAGDVAAALKRSGFEYDNSSKVYVKKLPNGKKLYKDPKTNRTWM